MRKLNPIQRLFVNVVFGAILLVFGTWIATSLLNPEQTKAAWFDTRWQYRQIATITNGNGSELTNYQVQLSLNTESLISAGKLRSDCGDIRVTNGKGVLLPHWIEGGSADCNTSATKIWVKIQSIPTSGGDLFLYYGNSSAQSISDGNKVFELFDDFSKVDEKKWNDTTGTNTITSAGYDNKALSTSGDENDIRFFSEKTFSGGYAVKARMREDSTDGGIFFDAQDNANGYLVTSRRGYGSGTAFQWYKRVAGAWTSLSGHNAVSTWTSSEFRTLEISRIGTAISIKDNETALTYSASTDATYSSGSVGIRGGTQQTIDWIFVRKAVTSEPSVSLGSEEQSEGSSAYWAFDEGQGSVANDSIGKNHGSLQGSPTWKNSDNCVSNKCLLFNGSSQYVSVPNNASLNPTTGLTVEAWVKPKSIANNTNFNIVAKQEWGNKLGYRLAITGYGCTTNCLFFGVGDGTNRTEYIPSGVNLNDTGHWYHIVGVFSSGTLKVYVDGVLRGSTTTPVNTISNTSSLLTIARHSGGSEYFPGFIDDVHIYPYARSDSQIKVDYNSRGGSSSSLVLGAKDLSALSNGLVGYWKMDESSWNGTSGEVKDGSGNGNDGTSTNGASATSSAKFGNSGSFDGNNDYVNIASMNSLPTSRITVSAWVKINYHKDWNTFVRHDWVGDGWLLYSNAAGSVLFGVGKSGTQYNAAVTNVSTGQWHYVVGIYDGSNVTVYVDGVKGTSTSLSNSTIDSSGQVGIGGIASSTMNGLIDEVRVYNRALSTSEISQLYNYAPGPVAYYNFEEKLGSTLNDRSGNNLNGSWNGSAPYWSQGKYGNGGQFNGTNANVQVPTTSSLNPGSASFTVSSWVKRTKTGVNIIFGKRTNTTTGYVAYFNSNTLVLNLNDAGGQHSYNVATNYAFNNKWAYITIVVDRVTNLATAYINGVAGTPVSISSVPTVVDSSTDFYLGRDAADGVNIFGGNLDEFRYYNYARTPSQITQDMNAGHPLGGSPVGSQLAYYKMEEGSGTSLRDSGPNNINGTITSCSWTTSGKNGRGLDCNGGGYVNLGTNTALNTPSFTYTTWIKTGTLNAGTGNANIILGKESYLNNGFRSGLTSAGLVSFWTSQSGGNINVTSTKAINDGNWHHIAFAYDDTTSTFTMYIDGVKNNTATGTYVVGTPGLYINGGIGGITRSNSSFDDFKVYSSALSADEIKIDYNQNSSLSFGAVSTESDGKTPSNSLSRAYCVPGDTSTCTPPIGEWKMDEGRGTSVSDTSGNGHDGTFGSSTAAPTWTQGKIGSAVQFDGTNDYIDTGDKFATDTVTVEAWVYPTKSGGAQAIVDNARDCCGTYNGYGLETSYTSNNAQFKIWKSDGSSSVAAGGANVDLNQWNFLVGTFDGSNLKFYKNGVLVGTTTSYSGTLGTPSFNVRIGSHGSACCFFGGKIDNVRIFNYARTASQVAWDYNQGKPIASYDFDECQGSTTHDLLNGINTNITIGASGSQTSSGTCSTPGTAWGNGATGRFNSSLSLDGTDDYVSFGDNSNFDFGTNDFSYCYWVNTTDTAGQLVGKSVWSYDAWGSYLSSGKARFEIKIENPPGSNYTADSAVINDGTWHHVCGIYNRSGSLSAYTDGKLTGNNTGLSSASTYDISNSGNFVIGNGNPGYLAGKIDDLKIFNYALTKQQVQTIYNQGGAVRFGPLTGSP